MEHIHLSGSEDVYRAASMVQSAAQDMIRASSNIDSSVYRLEQILDNFLTRLEQIMPVSKDDVEVKLK